jgi:hypothetical protein
MSDVHVNRGENKPLVIFGDPYADSIKTLRPFGPNVVATALANVSTPARRAARPSTPNLSSYCTMFISFWQLYVEKQSRISFQATPLIHTLCANLSW